MSVAERDHARAGERGRVDDAPSASSRPGTRARRPAPAGPRRRCSAPPTWCRRGASMTSPGSGRSRSACSPTRDRRDHVDLRLEERDHPHGGEDRCRAAHVALHRLHTLGVLDRQAAGVERDALARERDRVARCPRPCTRARSAVEGSRFLRRRPGCRRSRPSPAPACPRSCSVSPTSRAIFCASRAISAGGMSPAGVFTRSRAQQTASATTWPRLTASRAAFASALADPSTVIRVSAFVSEPRRLVAIEAVGAEHDAFDRRLHRVRGALAR